MLFTFGLYINDNLNKSKRFYVNLTNHVVIFIQVIKKKHINMTWDGNR